MTEDSLREVIDSVRTHLQQELEAQLAGVAERHAQAISAARAAAHADVEQRVAAEVTRVRVESDRQIHEEVARVRGEAQQHLQDEIARVRAEADQRVADAARKDPDPGSLLHAFRQLEHATTASGMLDAIARAASAQVPGSLLLLADSGTTQAWGAPAAARDAGHPLVTQALAMGQTATDGGGSIAVPLVLDGTPVGVLFHPADGASSAGKDSVDALEAIGRYGSAHLGYLTALKTGHAQQWIQRRASAPTAVTLPTSEDPEAAEGARRYARLLVSEIKLYNEAAVRAGREHRDLLRRLGPEVDRARRMYEERIASTPGLSVHFQQELVQILADGDPSLLG